MNRNNLKNTDRPMIAITGSAGKTTAKEMLASILQTRWNVFKSVGNLNFYNHTMMYKRQITPQHQAVVLEYGMSGPGQIKRHCKIIQPNIGIITNVGSAHIGNFGGDVRKLAAAKSELIHYMKPTGMLVLNRDDENSKHLLTTGFKGTKVMVGLSEGSDYRATAVQYRSSGMSFRVLKDGHNSEFFIPIYGRHHVYNALAAIAVAHRLGFRANEIRVGLRRYQRPIRRLQVHKLVQGITVIDDSYSANPHASKAAIDVLDQVGARTNILVLGTMLAMGSYSAKGHRDVGQYAARKRIHRLYTFGHGAKSASTAAVAAGLPASQVRHFTVREALHRDLIKQIQPGTTILIKGSHAMNMKDTVSFLLNRYRSKARVM